MDQAEQPKVNYSKLSPTTRAAIEKAKQNSPEQVQLNELQTMNKALQALGKYLESRSKDDLNLKADLADVMLDLRDALDAFTSKPDIEMPDTAKEVAGVLKPLFEKLSGEIGKLKLDPQINVQAPSVNVDAPVIDLSPIEKMLRTELVEAVKKLSAIKVPKAEVKVTTKELGDAFVEMNRLLGAINTGVRLKPEAPKSMSISNLDRHIELTGQDATWKDTTYYGDGVISGIAAVGIRYFDGNAWNRTPAVKLLWDDTTTANTVYVGKAPIGTATSSGAWQIQKINTSTKAITYADSGAFTAVWDDRASEVYG